MKFQLLSLFCILSFFSPALASPVRRGQPQCHLVKSYGPSSSTPAGWAAVTTTKAWTTPYTTKPVTTTTATYTTTNGTVNATSTTTSSMSITTSANLTTTMTTTASMTITTSATTTNGTGNTTTGAPPAAVATFILVIANDEGPVDEQYVNADYSNYAYVAATDKATNATKLSVDSQSGALKTDRRTVYLEIAGGDPAGLRIINSDTTPDLTAYAPVTCNTPVAGRSLDCSATVNGVSYNVLHFIFRPQVGKGFYYLALGTTSQTNPPQDTTGTLQVVPA